MRIAVFLTALLTVGAVAQVNTPLVGWLPEGTQFRPINGLPAAATLGPMVNTGHVLAGIAVSAAQNYVLATAADTQQVLLLVPGVSSTPLSVPLNPDQMVISPTGSAAALWYSATAQFEIISGLPSAPAMRRLSGSTLGSAPATFAVSDDGQWLAAASSNGAYAFGPNGSPLTIYSGADAGAVAFYAASDNLTLATATQLLSITNLAAGASSAVLDQGTFLPAGLAVSSDGQKIVYADQSGAIYSITASSGALATFNCQCRPGGVFGLGNEVFRLTSATTGAIKLFDASGGAILAVPRAGITPKRTVHPAQTTTTAPLPTLSIGLTPLPAGYLQQPAMTVTASAPYSSAISGTVRLAFTSSAGGTDQTIQFSSGGTTVNFTIPAGSTQANFSGASSVTLSTGTVAGTTTLTAAITAPTAVASAAVASFTNSPTIPFISKVSFTDAPGTVTVVITGFSSSREVASAVIDFAPSSNATINELNNISQNEISVPVSSYFETWYASSTAFATGSEFTLTIPFSVTGNSNDIVAVTVTLINSKGASVPVSPE